MLLIISLLLVVVLLSFLLRLVCYLFDRFRLCCLRLGCYFGRLPF